MRTPHLLFAVTLTAVSLTAPVLAPPSGAAPAGGPSEASAASGWEPARPVAGRGLENLLAFSRLLGFVRYFHPSDEAAATDWGRFAIEAVRAIEGAGTPEELAAELNRLFRPIAPSVSVFTTVGEMPGLPRSEPPADSTRGWIVAWRHLGLDAGAASDTGVDAGQPPAPFRSERVRVGPPADIEQAASQGLPSPRDPWVTDLTHGITCIVPLALYADDAGTLPRAIAPQAIAPQTGAADMFRAGFVPSGNDRATRLAVVALAWNAVQHFYPYFDVVPSHWPSTLARMLMEAAVMPDESMFLLSLKRMMAELRDGQAGAECAHLGPSGRLPLSWEWVEGALVITRCGPGTPEQIRVGDVVTAMDSLSTEEVLQAAEPIASGGTPAHRRRQALAELARGPAGKPARLGLRHPDGTAYAADVARVGAGADAGADAGTIVDPARHEGRPPQLAEVGVGIRYCDLCGVDGDSLRVLLPVLAGARGVVLDLRDGPGTPAILDHLIDRPVDSSQWLVPITVRPDRENVTYQQSGWQRQPAEPRFRGRAAFLTDAGVMGASEDLLNVVEHDRWAEIVGETTAGTIGDVVRVPLPGGYVVHFTGTKVLKPDGTRQHGVGIRPTLPVKRSIAGIAEGHDETLEQAVDLLREPAPAR
jgi:hypothetical protein